MKHVAQYLYVISSTKVIYLHYIYIPAAAKSLQSCPTLCDPIDGSPPGSPVPGILQARTLEWGAIAFSYLHSYMDRIFILNASTLNKLFCCFHKGPIKHLLLGCYSVRVGWTQWKNHSQYSGTTQ